MTGTWAEYVKRRARGVGSYGPEMLMSLSGGEHCLTIHSRCMQSVRVQWLGGVQRGKVALMTPRVHSHHLSSQSRNDALPFVWKIPSS